MAFPATFKTPLSGDILAEAVLRAYLRKSGILLLEIHCKGSKTLSELISGVV